MSTNLGTKAQRQPIIGISEDHTARVTRITVLLLFLAWLVDYIGRLVITWRCR